MCESVCVRAQYEVYSLLFYYVFLHAQLKQSISDNILSFEIFALNTVK